MKAIWNGEVVAESDSTIVVEGNHYFPPDSVQKQFLDSSQHQTICPWKGEASYHNLIVEGQENTNAAWYYAEPKEAAAEIKGYVAFWKGVEITE